MARTRTPLTDAERRAGNAERQARYRERHLKSTDGEKARLSLFLDLRAHKQIGRIARHRGYTVTALIEEWAAKTERRIVDRMTPEKLRAYYDENP